MTDGFTDVCIIFDIKELRKIMGLSIGSQPVERVKLLVLELHLVVLKYCYFNVPCCKHLNRY